ncbi:MAG: hypothetical protein AAGD18_01790 [Actinomycetota bacterium]
MGTTGTVAGVGEGAVAMTGERVFRASPMLAFAYGLALMLGMYQLASSFSGANLVIIGSWMASSAYFVVLSLRTQVVVDEHSVRVRWAIRSRTVERAQIREVQRRKHDVRLVVGADGATFSQVTFPTVRELDELERTLRDGVCNAALETPPDLLIHQGGLMRRWFGPVHEPG